MNLLIIGSGLAGTVLAYKASLRNWNVKVVDAGISAASSAAYGMMNPVHIRNATLSWNAPLFFAEAERFYLGHAPESSHATSIVHLLSSDDEAVLWRQNVESGSLSGFANGDREEFLPHYFDQPFGSTRIERAVFVDIPKLIPELKNRQNFQQEIVRFTPQSLQNKDSGFAFQESEYDAVVFCEGTAAMENPYFAALPFRPCKGDVLTISAPDLKLDEVVHKKIFLIPLGNGQFRAGSTYEWNDLSPGPSAAGREEIEDQLRSFLKVPFTVVGHKAGIRPAMADRRPVVGQHPYFPGIYILNGLGSRGLIQVPYFAEALIREIAGEGEVMESAHVRRFQKRLKPN